MAKYDIFLEDLAKIKDANVRSFTESALDAVDDRFVGVHDVPREELAGLEKRYGISLRGSILPD